MTKIVKMSSNYLTNTHGVTGLGVMLLFETFYSAGQVGSQSFTSLKNGTQLHHILDRMPCGSESRENLPLITTVNRVSSLPPTEAHKVLTWCKS